MELSTSDIQEQGFIAQSNELVAKLEAAKKELSAPIRNELLAMFRSLFEKFPKITGVRWAQYTPYFNDGDECVFGVNDPCFCVDATDENEATPILDEILGTGGWYDWNYYSGPATKYFFELGYKADNTLPYVNAIKDMQKIINSIDDSIMKIIFGDHVLVSLFSDGLDFEIEDYDHD